MVIEDIISLLYDSKVQQVLRTLNAINKAKEAYEEVEGYTPKSRNGTLESGDVLQRKNDDNAIAYATAKGEGLIHLRPEQLTVPATQYLWHLNGEETPTSASSYKAEISKESINGKHQLQRDAKGNIQHEDVLYWSAERRKLFWLQQVQNRQRGKRKNPVERPKQQEMRYPDAYTGLTDAQMEAIQPIGDEKNIFGDAKLQGVVDQLKECASRYSVFQETVGTENYQVTLYQAIHLAVQQFLDFEDNPDYQALNSSQIISPEQLEKIRQRLHYAECYERWQQQKEKLLPKEKDKYKEWKIEKADVIKKAGNRFYHEILSLKLKFLSNQKDVALLHYVKEEAEKDNAAKLVQDVIEKKRVLLNKQISQLELQHKIENQECDPQTLSEEEKALYDWQPTKEEETLLEWEYTEGRKAIMRSVEAGLSPEEREHLRNQWWNEWKQRMYTEELWKAAWVKIQEDTWEQWFQEQPFPTEGREGLLVRMKNLREAPLRRALVLCQKLDREENTHLLPLLQQYINGLAKRSVQERAVGKSEIVVPISSPSSSSSLFSSPSPVTVSWAEMQRKAQLLTEKNQKRLESVAEKLNRIGIDRRERCLWKVENGRLLLSNIGKRDRALELLRWYQKNIPGSAVDPDEEGAGYIQRYSDKRLPQDQQVYGLLIEAKDVEKFNALLDQKEEKGKKKQQVGFQSPSYSPVSRRSSFSSIASSSSSSSSSSRDLPFSSSLRSSLLSPAKQVKAVELADVAIAFKGNTIQERMYVALNVVGFLHNQGKKAGAEMVRGWLRRIAPVFDHLTIEDIAADIPSCQGIVEKASRSTNPNLRLYHFAEGGCVVTADVFRSLEKKPGIERRGQSAPISFSSPFSS